MRIVGGDLGGRVLRALLAIGLGQDRATRIATIVGQLFAVFFVVAGIWGGQLLLAFVGFFVFLGASQELAYQRSRSAVVGHTAKEAMIRRFETLQPQDSLARAAEFERLGRVDAEAYGLGPARVQLQNKDPIGWRTFMAHLAERPAHAAAKTLRRVQAARAALDDLEGELKGIAVPVLLLLGDEDEPCLDVNLWMKRLLPNARLAVLPGSGHAINLEEPALFNQLVEQFLADVERGSWRPRDPRAKPGAVLSSLGGPPKS